MDNINIKYNKMKDGIYFSGENGGITYFILNEKILMRLMGQTYKCTKHFMFGEYKTPLQPLMIEKFDEVYNDVEQW